jgi:hypothetical protein
VFVDIHRSENPIPKPVGHAKVHIRKSMVNSVMIPQLSKPASSRVLMMQEMVKHAILHFTEGAYKAAR